MDTTNNRTLPRTCSGFFNRSVELNCSLNDRKLFTSACAYTVQLITLFLAITCVATAQTSDPAAGFPAFVGLVKGQLDTLNLPYGNIFVQLPLRSKVGKYPVSYDLVGNSHMYIGAPPNGNFVGQWQISSISNWLNGAVSGSPFASNLGATAYNAITTTEQCGALTMAHVYSGWYVLASDGTHHSFPASLSIDECANESFTGVTVDGSGYTVQLTMTNGGTVNAQLSVTLWDRSGNISAFNCGGSYEYCITDSDGTKMYVSLAGSSSSVIDTLGQVVVTSNPHGAPSAPDTYVYSDAKGNQQTLNVNYTQKPVVTAFGCAAIADFVPSNQPMPTSVVYPDGETIKISYEKNSLSVLPPWQASHQYSFYRSPGNYLALLDSNGNLEGVVTAGTSGASQPVWNTTLGGKTTDGTVVWQNYGKNWTSGRIASITYAQGGSVTYAYPSGSSCGSGPGGWPAQINRTVNDNNGNSGTWKYQVSSISSNGTLTVTETDPASNVTKLYFASATSSTLSPCTTSYNPAGCTYSFVQTAKLSYSGTAISTHLIGQEVTCYNLKNSSETACITPSVPITFPIQYTDRYSHPIGVNGAVSAPNDVETGFDPYGNVSFVSYFDYGQTFPPTKQAVRTTTTLYDGENASCGSLSIAAMHDRPCSVGTGSSQKTLYTFNPAGHPTQTQVLVSGSYLTSSATYNSNGTIASFTDVNSVGNSAVTNYHYDGTGGCNNLLLTSTVLPVNSLTTSQKWECSGGVMTSSTDENGKSTSYGYVDQNGNADPLWRRRSVTDSMLNTTWTSFSPGGTLPASVETSLLFNSGTSAMDVLTTFDGIGRPYLKQTRQAPGSSTFDTTVTTYDVVGRVASVGVPCPSTASTSCSSPTTQTTYDAISRPLQVTDGGGGYTSYSYINNDVLVTRGPAPTIPLAENTKRTQLEYDGLGRLASVCELTSTANGGGTCTQSTSQTGYWTKYAYDVLDNLQTVTQNAQATSQSRTYNYDGLSRLTSESNPESGTTQYYYDQAPASPGVACSGPFNGDLVKRYDANGNTTCYSYDALHRMLSTTYSGPNATTTNRYFVYDAASVNNQSMVNANGTIAEAYTATCTTCTKVTDEGFSYDARGELANFYESTPNSAGYYSVPVTYWPNGLVETFGPFLTEDQVGYIPDGEGRIYSLYNFTHGNTMELASTNYNSASQPTQLMTSCNGSGSPCYPITYSYDANTLRMTQYSVALNGGTISGTPTWNPNGSLQQLVIADPFNSADAQTCTYSADDLSRIASVSCGSTWAQTFSYDPFGNLTKSGSISWIPGYNSSTNRYTLAGTSYDANGNVLNDTFNQYAWDVEGKPITTLYGINGLTYAFTYDAFGHRVESSVSGTYQGSYVNLGKFKLSAHGQTPGYSETPLPGGSVASQGGGLTSEQMADWLGTIRAVYTYTNGNFTKSAAHAPFGETYSLSGGPTIPFTGESDDGNAVNTTHYFPERQYRSSQGRWLSPDPAGVDTADATNPQSWNRYSYVLNNPLLLTDPDGLDCVYLNDAGDEDESVDHNSNIGECEKHGGLWANGYVCPNCIQTDPNSDNVLITSSINGFLGTTLAGLGWSKGPFDVGTFESSPISDDLTPSAKIVLSNVYRTLNGLDPELCNSGGFGFAGFQVKVPYTKIKAEVLAIGNYDSKQGVSAGGLLEAHIAGPLSAGYERAYNFRSHKWTNEGLGFVGKETASAKFGTVGGGLLLTGHGDIGGYGFVGPVGGGGYATLAPGGMCR